MISYGMNDPDESKSQRAGDDRFISSHTQVFRLLTMTTVMKVAGAIRWMMEVDIASLWQR